MLKKLIIVLTIAVYGVPSSGMTFYIHYCCGKVDKINLSGSDNKKCPFVFQASSAKGCCDSKKVEVKIKSDHEPGYSIKNFCKLFSDSHTLTASAVISLNKTSPQKRSATKAARLKQTSLLTKQT